MTPVRTSADDDEKALHQHMAGDEHSALGIRYECALRCLWLLELRGTEKRLAIAEGEDAKVMLPDGRTIYRQVKKRETAHWTFDRSFKAFLVRAYGRFSSDPSIRHEFYTNQAIPGGRTGLNDQGQLNAAHRLVRETAPEQTEVFCKTIGLFPSQYQPDPNLMMLVVRSRFRSLIDGAYQGCKAGNFVSEQEIDDLAARLLTFEYRLGTCGDAVEWRDVEVELGLDRFISDLRFRSMADGALMLLEQWPTVQDGGPDSELTRAIEAAREGRLIPRPKLESEIWSGIDEWWAEIARGGTKPRSADYRVVVLAGSHGTGKTWSLVRIGGQIETRYDGIAVCIAATSPPSRTFGFGELAIAQPRPCAILIDDFFPEWSGLASSIVGPLPYPLVIVVTAARSADDHEIQGLTHRLGRRAIVVELPDHLEDGEAQGFAQARRVPLSASEAMHIRSSNVRRFARILSGRVSGPESISVISALLSGEGVLDLLGPILLCTSLRVSIPKELFEKSVGRALSAQLQPWVLGSRGGAGQLLALEDPDEAAVVLEKVLGGALAQKRHAWCQRFLEHVNPRQVRDRAFTRRLFGRLAREIPESCKKLIESCESAVDLVIAFEPMWALVFSWGPIFTRSGCEDRLRLAVPRVIPNATTVAEIAVLLEAYGSAGEHRFLSSWLAGSRKWSPVMGARFIESVMELPKNDRRGIAVRLSRFLCDLPVDTFAATLSQRSCFNAATTLAASFGGPDDRRVFLHRIGQMITDCLEAGGAPRQDWFDSFRKLTERVIHQGRAGLALMIGRELITKGRMAFGGEDQYKECFEEEQALVHLPVIRLGIAICKCDEAQLGDSLPPLAGSLVAFASSWAQEGDWLAVVEMFLELLESLSAKDLSFDRVSAVVLPAFSGMRRGPKWCAERFLEAVLQWVPDERKVATLETAKLVLHILGFVGTQPGVEERDRAKARRVLMSLIGHCDQADASAASAEAYQRGMFNGWINEAASVSTYLSQVGRIKWEQEERIALVKQLIALWANMKEARQHLIEALLRLGDLAGARALAIRMTDEMRAYPDYYGYLAIINIKEGDLRGAYQYWSEVIRIRDEHKRGIHPHLALWFHREAARLCEGRRRVLHFLCAELSSKLPLRPFKDMIEVIEESRGSIVNSLE